MRGQTEHRSSSAVVCMRMGHMCETAVVCINMGQMCEINCLTTVQESANVLLRKFRWLTFQVPGLCIRAAAHCLQKLLMGFGQVISIAHTYMQCPTYV